MKSSREVRPLLQVSLFLARIPGTTGLLVLPNSSYFPAHCDRMDLDTLASAQAVA